MFYCTVKMFPFFPLKHVKFWVGMCDRSFLLGLDTYGKGDWKKISQNFVSSKYPSQVASHAQKFEQRMHPDTT